jgi:hypothetical protein
MAKGAFPPRPQSVRIWAVNPAGGASPVSSPGSSAAESARAGTVPGLTRRVLVGVLASFAAVSGLIALAWIVLEQLGT